MTAILKSLPRFAILVGLAIASTPTALAELTVGAFVPGLSTPSGTDGPVDALLSFDDGSGPALFVGGGFSEAGDTPTTGIARFAGGTFGALGPGLDGRVRTLIAFDDGSGVALYAGGDFEFAGSTRVAHVARWDGAAWTPLGMGTDGPVHALEVYDDGSGAALYAGGEFTTAGGRSALRVARWSGGQWSGLGEGFDGVVRALESIADGATRRLVAGGAFERSGDAPRSRLAAWNGRNWTPVRGGVDREVLALAAFDDGTEPALYVGGRFRWVGGSLLSPLVVRLERGGFRQAGLGLPYDMHFVSAFGKTVLDGRAALLAAGFLRFGGQYRDGSNVARLVGRSRWEGFGRTLFDPWNAPVAAISNHDDGAGSAIFVGGSFTRVNGRVALRLSRLDSTGKWAPAGPGLDASVRALARFPSMASDSAAIHVAGDFKQANGEPAPRVARWNGTEFEPLPSGPNWPVNALRSFDDGKGEALYAAGIFGSAGGVPATGLARWDGSAWDAVDPSVRSFYSDFAVFDDGRGAALYAAGWSDVVRWDGRAIETLPTDWNPFTSLAVFDDGTGPSLCAGRTRTNGAFGAVSRFDGTAWLGLGDANGPVHAVASLDDGNGPALFAAGRFTTIGGVACANVAHFDGSTWSPLGTGVDGEVFALAAYDPGSGPLLVAGGRFGTAGGSPAANLAIWDGASWSPIGSGLDGPAYRLIASDGPDGVPELWIGGDFSNAGGVASAFVACWKDPLANALAGTVGRRHGAPENVLFVSDATGGRERCVRLVTYEPFSIFVSAPTRHDGHAPFALYAWSATPDATTIRALPRGIGSTALPTPLSGASDALRVVWNNTGRLALGPPSRPSKPAPSMVFYRGSGLGRGANVYLQGIIRDSGSAGDVPASVTNGIHVNVR